MKKRITDLKKIKRKIKNKFNLYSGVSIIIPTYKENIYLNDCINSVLNQTIKKNKLEIILSINGQNTQYYENLKNKYKNNNIIKVIYQNKTGLSAARNNGVKYITKKYFIFLDDDDYFTEGYLKELLINTGFKINIVCGKLINKEENQLNNNTYINKVLLNAPKNKTKDYFEISGIFTPVWAKLYKTKFYKQNFNAFNENINSGEDILFWCNNFIKLKGYVYCCDNISNEALIRRIVIGSISRPLQEDLAFNFYIKDRINLIEIIENEILTLKLTHKQKRFLLNKINFQYRFMLDYYNSLNKVNKKNANILINQSNSFFINKFKISEIEGLAFCYIFLPFADQDGYEACEILPQISEFEDIKIKWDVISYDMTQFIKRDDNFAIFYSYYIINQQILIEKNNTNLDMQTYFCSKSNEITKNKKANYIYSNSKYSISHLAAYEYKICNKNIKWYADFCNLFKEKTNWKKSSPDLSKYELFCSDNIIIEELICINADIILLTKKIQEKLISSINNEIIINNILKKSIIIDNLSIENNIHKIIKSKKYYDYKFN